MKVVVCGSRAFGSSRWRGTARALMDLKIMRARLGGLPRGTVLIHGGGRGADKIAGVIGRQLGFEVREFPADWKHHGRGAGIRRNRQMLDELDPAHDRVLAYRVAMSTGTTDTVEEAERRGIQTEVYDL